MNIAAQLTQARISRFVALILDNEVTVGEFVTKPPLPWARIARLNGVFQIAAGYPNLLTAAQAKFEMKNWDDVSLPGIERILPELGDGVDYIVIGNNAGQGLALAQGVPQSLIADRAARLSTRRACRNRAPMNGSAIEISSGAGKPRHTCWRTRRRQAARRRSTSSIRFNTIG